MASTNNLPYIEIFITHTLDTEISKKDILQTMKNRFEKTQNVPVSWLGDEESPILRVEYPSKEKFVECYQYGIPFFDKLKEILEDEKVLHEFPMDKFIEKQDLEDSETLLTTYLILRYKTNVKEIMRQNYEYTWQFAKFLQTEFFVEEIEDGFLMFYKHKDDFMIQQIDRMDFDEVKAWIEKKKIDISNPGVSSILDYLKNR